MAVQNRFLSLKKCLYIGLSVASNIATLFQKNVMTILLAFCCWLAVISPAQAADTPYSLNVEYKNFYTHLRKVDAEALPHLHLAFGFTLPTSKRTCAIDNVYIHTPKKDIPIAVSEASRFSLPKERALKLADAEVHIRFTPNMFHDSGLSIDECHLSVRLEADLSRHNALSPTELQALNREFKSFFESMGVGLFSFMMPEPQGIRVHLKKQYANEHSHGLFHGLSIVNGIVLLDDNWIRTNLQTIDLIQVSHMTAWVEKQE